MTTTVMTEQEARDAARRAPLTTYAGHEVRAGIERDGNGWTVAYRVFRDGQFIAPGATWSRTEAGALQTIDVLIVTDHDGEKFWHLLRAIQRGAANGAL